jgi:hypothetical protein
MAALLPASAALAIAVALIADSLPGVSSSGSVTQVAEPLPSLTADYTTGSAQQTTWGVGTNVKRTRSSPAYREPPRTLKRRRAAKRTNGDDKSSLIDLCEANMGEWCTSWSADGYGSDPCRDKWTGVHCDSRQFRVTGL